MTEEKAMHGLFSVAQVRAIEQAAAASLPPGTLMERAGRAAAGQALQLLAGIPAPRVLVLAGPGNNGGDALEVAANLAQANVDVCVVLTHPEKEYASFEARRALERAKASSAAIGTAPDGDWDLAVDGMFGIGLQRPLDDRTLPLLERVQAAGRPVLALDCPSGLDVDTGSPLGVAVRASHTATFIADKPGLHTGRGREYAGQVTVHSLDVGDDCFPETKRFLNAPELFAFNLAPRAVDSHKGRFGDVAILGGADGMAGAPVLSARAALYGGAGRVLAFMLARSLPYDPVQPEIMFRDASTYEKQTTSVVVGPGLGNTPEAIKLLLAALDDPAPLVLDADALNLLALSPDLRARLRTHGDSILTPHPLEAARLLDECTANVQSDRLASAATLAKELNGIVVLKGAGTVIAAPDGRIVINGTGNPGLASAGTGDVLAGLAGALLAQGWPAWEAAIGSVYMHGLAADQLVANGIGPIGLTAGELPAAIRTVRNQLTRSALLQS
jgi:hydroxyethylthiazole kinase-like uncharacterized protein yjeF